MNGVIEAVHFYDENRNNILSHTYTGRPLSASHLLPLYLEHPTPRPNVIYLANTNPPTLVFSLVHSNLLLLLTSSSEIEPFLALEFLHRVVDVFEEFLGAPLISSKIEQNYDVVAQLLTEMCDAGSIATTEPNALRDLVEVEGWVGKILGSINLPGKPGFATSFANSTTPPLTSANTPALPWRRANVRHTSNELYADLVETISVTLAPSGRPLAAFANGTIAFTSKVSGVPDILMTLTSPSGKHNLTSIVELPVFHPCVRLARWKERPGELSFIPPDGRCVLAGYEVDLLPNTNGHVGNLSSTNLKLPVQVDVKTGIGPTGSDFEVRLHVLKVAGVGGQAQSSLIRAAVGASRGISGPQASAASAPVLEDLAVRIPLPSDVRNLPEIRPSRGDATFNPVEGVLEWSVPGKELSGGTSLFVLRCTVAGQSGEADEEEEPSTTDFGYDEAYQNDSDLKRKETTRGSGTTPEGTQDNKKVLQNKALMPSSVTVSFSVKGWLASGLRVESISLDTRKSRGLGEGVKPYKGVKYLTVSKGGVEIRCQSGLGWRWPGTSELRYILATGYVSRGSTTLKELGYDYQSEVPGVQLQPLALDQGTHTVGTELREVFRMTCETKRLTLVVFIHLSAVISNGIIEKPKSRTSQSPTHDRSLDDASLPPLPSNPLSHPRTKSPDGQLGLTSPLLGNRTYAAPHPMTSSVLASTALRRISTRTVSSTQISEDALRLSSIYAPGAVQRCKIEAGLVPSLRRHASTKRKRPRTAIFFPGHGVQRVGMFSPWLEAFPRTAREIVDEIDHYMGYKFSDVVQNGTNKALGTTANAQPAIMATSILILRILEREFSFNVGDQFDVTLGHSLGEFAALVAGGYIEFEDSLYILRKRAAAMAEATQRAVDEFGGEYGMVAIVTEPEYLPALIKAIHDFLGQSSQDTPAIKRVSIANINSKNQIVLSGNIERIKTLVGHVRQFLGHDPRAVRLNTDSPFHSPIMRPAVSVMRNLLDKKSRVKGRETEDVITFPGIIPCVSNVTARPFASKDDIKDLLARQCEETVNWWDSIKYLDQEEKVRRWVGIGPGKVGRNLVGKEVGIRGKDVVKGAGVWAITDPKDIEEVLKGLEETAGAVDEE